MRILAVSDEESKGLWDYFAPEKLKGIDLIVSCGDLDANYVSFLATMAHVPVIYVHGNHDEAYDRKPPGGAVCIDDQVAKNFVAANPDELTTLDTAFAEESYAIAVSKDNSDLTEQLNGAIAALKEDGTLDAILDKYIAKVEGAEGYVSPEGTEYPNGTLVMATNAAFDPYEYIENGEIVGIDAEFAKALCDKLGYDLEIEDMEFDSIIAAVVSGKADFGMAGMTVTPEREEQIDFTDTYCTAAQNVIVLK